MSGKGLKIKVRLSVWNNEIHYTRTGGSQKALISLHLQVPLMHDLNKNAQDSLFPVSLLSLSEHGVGCGELSFLLVCGASLNFINEEGWKL